MLEIKFCTDKVGLISLSLLVLACASMCSASEDLPKFYLSSKSHDCPLDSPDPYYIQYVEKSIAATVTETRVFFEEFLDLLASTAKTTTGYNASAATWDSIWKELPENLDLTTKRIYQIWGKLITTDETQGMPWEIKLKRAVIIELLNQINDNYVIALDGLVRTEIQNILVSLQGAIAKVVEEMKKTKPDIGIGDSFTILLKSEELLEVVEPNFIGRLFARVLRADRELKISQSEGIFPPKPRTFLTAPLEQIQHIQDGFKSKIQKYPGKKFWHEITKAAPSSVSDLRNEDELSGSYAQNEDLIITTTIDILLSGNTQG